LPGARGSPKIALLFSRGRAHHPDRTMTNFIGVYPNVLAPELCADIIRRFEEDPRQQASETAAGRGTGRTGTQLKIAGRESWADVNAAVMDAFNRCLHDYAGKYRAIEFLLRENCAISGFVIERTHPGQQFDWHIDSGPAQTYRTFLTCLLYLNDVEDGGATEFAYQRTAVRPKAGTLTFFPPYWTHLHRGAPPVSGTKYKITAHCYTAT
jgi:2OG-Fe(II) oxygenase superfamily